MTKLNDIMSFDIKVGDTIMSDNIEIKNIDGIDVVQFQPRGVCCKMMNFKIKDDILIETDFMGGCNGNLKGIGVLVKGMNINEIIQKLQGLPCGVRPTSCPDQLTKGLVAYIEAKQGATV